METLGLSLAEGKALLQGVQDFVASQQVSEDLTAPPQLPELRSCGITAKQRERAPSRRCSGRWRYLIRDGNVAPCQKEGPKTFRPTATWLKGRTSPERLYLETKWASLIPYEKVADLLKEVLPVSESTNHETVREHLHAVAERMEAELGEERQPIR